MNKEQFFKSIKNKKVAFCGLGKSNLPLIHMFIKEGVQVYACDRREPEQLAVGLADELVAAGATLVLGSNYLKQLDLINVDVIFRTPGMNYNSPELIEARKKGIVVTSEMEVFFDLCPCKIFAVTGSDGKTTTTTLIATMLKEQGYTVHLGGNIGTPLLPRINEIGENNIAIAELSSFQLISMKKSPDVSVVTNVAPNHLDVHKTMDEYIDAKKNIFMHQNAFSRTVLNADNKITASFADEVRGVLSHFSYNGPVTRGAYLDGDDIYVADKNGAVKIMNKHEIRIPGEHNVENYLAAISAVWGYVDSETIVKVAREFGGVEHRIEFVREKDGVRYYNDSIATSPTRTIAGLKSFNKKLIVLAGGYDKHIPFEPLAPYAVEKIKVLILTGPTADAIEKAIRADEGFEGCGMEILRSENLEQSVKMAHEIAKEGDIVSLSPACASFDAYPNFEERGNHYKKLVNEL